MNPTELIWDGIKYGFMVGIAVGWVPVLIWNIKKTITDVAKAGE